MHKLIIAFLMGLFLLPVSAQEYEVISFVIDQTDLSARRNPRVDLNGKPCALIKVYTTDNIADVRGNVVGDISVIGMEKWVYVESGTKQLEFVFDSHKPLKVIFDDYNITEVSQKSTYVLDLREVLPGLTTTVAQSPVATQSTVTSPKISEEEIFDKMKENYKNKNYKKIMELALEIQDNPKAQNIIGDLYYNGKGATQDYTEAMKWYRKAADLGNALAMFNIGYLYDCGYGISRDSEEALKWYRKAADLGNKTAINALERKSDELKLLGDSYYDGNGVSQDYVEAMKWYCEAANLGNADAMFNIGYLYDCGYGVSRDSEEALKWYRKAADLGNKTAINALERKRNR